MTTLTDNLTATVDRLDQCLNADCAGEERSWAERVGLEIKRVTRALGQHAADAETSSGLFSEIDLTRPSLARHVGALRQEHGSLAEQARKYEEEVAVAAKAFRFDYGLTVHPNDLPEPAPAGLVGNIDEIRRRGQELVSTLRHHCELETDLVQESVTTDLGAGD